MVKLGSLANVAEMLLAVQDFCSGTNVFTSEKQPHTFALNMDQIKQKENAMRVVVGTKLIDKIFAMYASTRISGLSKADLKLEPELLKIHKLVGRTIVTTTTDKITQIYCAMQHFDSNGPEDGGFGYTTNDDKKFGQGKIIQQLKRKSANNSYPGQGFAQYSAATQQTNNTQQRKRGGGGELVFGAKKGTGFLGELLAQVSWNLGASQILDSIVTNNHVLVKELVDNQLIHHFISSLVFEAPETPSLEFLASINLCTNLNGQYQNLIDCQESLSKYVVQAERARPFEHPQPPPWTYEYPVGGHYHDT